eukprot:GFKZ01011804.1.p1 GENE.GFKZ01011804.1~~GFKZ01011804.1.p1  ORF type:complete len:314 (-),score=6.24 GFKZ01011804.1:44-985(-)
MSQLFHSPSTLTAFLPALPLSQGSTAPVVCSSPTNLRTAPLCVQTTKRARLVPPPLPTSSPGPIKRPTAEPKLTAQGDSLDSTPLQVAVVGAFTLFAALLPVKLLASCRDIGDVALNLGGIGLSYLFTDLAVGIYHHSVDNYGSAKTPVFGYQIAAFQGHHEFPWTITNRDVANNLYRLTIPTLPQLLWLLICGPDGPLTAAYGSFLVWVVVAQEAHRQAHMTRAAGWVRRLQDWGLIVSRGAHLRHHSGGHGVCYCILSGVWNKWLDESKVFRWWEGVVWGLTGVEPICWRDDPRLREQAIDMMPAALRRAR